MPCPVITVFSLALPGPQKWEGSATESRGKFLLVKMQACVHLCYMNIEPLELIFFLHHLYVRYNFLFT